jgi:hypothetical protein
MVDFDIFLPLTADISHTFSSVQRVCKDQADKPFFTSELHKCLHKTENLLNLWQNKYNVNHIYRNPCVRASAVRRRMLYMLE